MNWIEGAYIREWPTVGSTARPTTHQSGEKGISLPDGAQSHTVTIRLDPEYSE